MSAQEYEFLVEVAPGRDAAGDVPSASPIYRSHLSKDGFETEFKGCKTLLELYKKVKQEERNRPFLGRREVKEDGSPGRYEWSTYRDVGFGVAAIETSLRKLGCTRGSKVGIYGANCPEWFIAMQACHFFAGVYVPVYDSLGAHAVEYILGHSEAEFVFVSREKLADLVAALKAMDATSRKVTGVVYWGEKLPSEEGLQMEKDLESYGIKFWDWRTFDQLGILLDEETYPPFDPAPEDPAMIMYTSGTTGDPKGVVMSHRGMIALIASSLKFGETNKLNVRDEVYMSYLPLAHIYGQVMEYLTMASGSKIGYWRGSVGGLISDIQALKPTSLAGVPRVWERVYNEVMKQLSGSFIRKYLFDFAYNWKLHYIEQGIPASKASPLADRIIFNKIKAKLGGKVNWVSSGAAPLAPHLENFIRVAFGVPGFQGYGLSETGGITFGAAPDRYDMFGTVGPVQACAEFRLESVPELEYDAQGDVRRGEICIRGPCLFTNYLKNDAEYEKAVDKDGFFHTGDVGELHPTGAVKIIDRLKNIFKLSQGEYVAVEKIESILKAAPTVEQIWVYGNSMRRSLLAIIHPNARELAALGHSSDLETLCNSEAAKNAVMEQIAAAAQAGELKGFEKVRDVRLVPEAFTVENELMTPSFKVKRHAMLKKFQKEVDEMYEKLEGAL